MASIEAPVIVAIIYGLGSLIVSAMKRQQRAQTGTSGRSVPVPSGQRRAETMEDLLAEMREQLERKAGTIDPVTPAPADGLAWSKAEDQEEFTSLETEPVVVSIEGPRRDDRRPERDYDAEAAGLIKRRIDAAEARNHEWTPADHRAFDKRIRATVPELPVASTRLINAARLREAFVWREILGPPVGWPDRDTR